MRLDSLALRAQNRLNPDPPTDLPSPFPPPLGDATSMSDRARIALYALTVFLSSALALRLSGRTGHIVGMMHALAAVGSIGGTFISGYWLIQTFGSRSVILATAATLALLALPLVSRGRRLVYPALLPVGGVLLAITHARDGLKRRWFNVTQPVLATGTPLTALPLLSDDHVPVERLMASLFVTPLGR